MVDCRLKFFFLSRLSQGILKSIVMDGHAECTVHTKREISLAKVYLACKHHATFLENNKLFIA